jgi:hypothetical protein
MPQYQWLTYLQARQALAARLADPNNVFWSDIENGLYLIEALRTWNALTEVWNTDFVFSAAAPSVWFDLSTFPGSPRLRTLTDTYLYTLMQYHLLEPPSGGTWTGTSQFSIADLAGALARRRDEMIQVSGCNLAQLPPLPSTPNTRRTVFADSTLEPRRARWVPDSGTPTTLNREDSLAWDSFQTRHLQQTGTPANWGVIAGPPLAMDVDVAPNTAGTYDVLSLQAGPNFFPPAATLLGVPDDWSWLAKWGALADLLSRDSEATDRPRADWCLKRYTDGLKIMKESNWLLLATINGSPVNTPDVREMDGFAPEWQNNAVAWPSLVTAGIDLCAPCPVAGSTPFGVSCVLVGNAPVPVLDTDFIQCSRDTFDVILDYAQVLASFKQGGEEFAATKDLEKGFYQFAAETNKRLLKMGVFGDLLRLEGRRQDIAQPR